MRLSRKDPQLLQPVRVEDGFEDQLRQWSRRFSNGKGDAAARAAMFLKGKIRGSTLLTLAYDSEKETRARLLRDIRPEEFYPVYGDASIKGFDARSADKLYVRVDRDKSYLLYGDYSTGDGFLQRTAGGVEADMQLRRLGAYSRTLTGLRGHWQKSRGFLNTFGSYDNLKQVVEEYRANGTSGPFAVRNSSALENSEKVELLVRDRNALSNILSIAPLQRFSDYSFEPFSGRLLFKAPIPSLDESGNPLSIRITYEVDQGGEQFWLGGLDGQWNLNDRTTLGGSYVSDRNPLSPYDLASANVGLRLGANGSVTAEYARSESRRYRVGADLFTNPTGRLGESAANDSGNAWRISMQFGDTDNGAEGWVVRTGAGFDNPNAGIAEAREEAGLRGRRQLTDRVQLEAEALRVDDREVDARRDGATVGARVALSERVALLAGLRYLLEDGDVGGQTFIAGNPSPGSLLNPTGGFLGGNDAGQINPLTGQRTTQNVPGATPASAGAAFESVSGYLGLQWRATDRLRAAALAETGLDGDRGQRYELGAAYQVAERARLYARGEQNTGLASVYSLNPDRDSRALLVGVDTSYLQTEDRTGQLFSEYRLRDAQSAYESQAATGLRNTFTVREGVALSAGAEYLQILDGTGASAAALTFGVDYTASEFWKASARLEGRRAFDTTLSVGDEQQDSWLSTLTVARKLDREWTLLARNYYLLQQNQEFASGLPRPDAWQDRFQLGFAYRPVDHNRFDSLTKYEWRAEDNIAGDAATATVHIVSVLANWHPNRRWWWNGRLAGKHRKDSFAAVEGGGTDSYAAWLVGSRLTYDIGQKWDVGAIASVLSSNTGNAQQHAYGVEIGRAMHRNVWLSLGYNVSGFRDDDLTGSDYTNSGVYLRLRFKFDENLFRGKEPDFNRALDR